MAARRPPNRREQIRVAATELFLERGYHNVSVTDVADALGITASALYHHYRNKQDLLFQAILSGLDTVDCLIQEAGALDDALRSLAALVTGPRKVFAVWEREARNLDGSQREAIREREAEVAAHFGLLLRVARPELGAKDAELVSRAVLGALGSRGRHQIRLPRRRHEQLMYRLGSMVAHCPLPPGGKSGDGLPLARPHGPIAAGLRMPRRDQILTEAIRLFDERGYQSVTMADIGEAVGIVASGVYRHFPGKVDLLVAATNRAGERIRAAAEQALLHAADPRSALALLLRAHIDVSVENAHLIGILAHERDQLPEKERTALRRVQAAYLDVWLQALSALQPGQDPAEIKIEIHATHAMTSFVIRSTRNDMRPDRPERLAELALHLLLDCCASNDPRRPRPSPLAGRPPKLHALAPWGETAQ
ncbi:TetR/AcrR family transcriptional regulator [Streptomyces sp. NPDC057580]|uniref:TetR/AcrR family transcriptional regulator n=1 Tax=Streptomyces sp. NPDC057580 TaxID=3346173 RepID=UPI0036AD78E0